MNFEIKHKGVVKGVANYMDEAMQFVERISRIVGAWNPSGHFILTDGQPTGWWVERVSY